MRDRRSGRAPVRALVLGVTILTAATLVACGGGEATEEEAGAAVAVRTEVVAVSDFTESVSAIGEVTPRIGHVAAIGAPAPTRVTSVLVTSGDRVSMGANLVDLESSVFASAAKGARATAEAARQNADRARRLVDAGILPRRDLEAATAALAAADADLVVAERNVELGMVRAPFDGVITRVTAVVGAAVDVGDVLVEIADPSAVDILFAVPANDAARIRVGAVVQVRSDEGDSAVAGRGTVAEVGGVVDAVTRSVAVRVRVVTALRPLRIGEMLSGDITVATIRAALVVPVEALVPDGDGFKVFVVDSADVAHAQAVTVGARHAGVARLLGGVAAGDRVVTYGAYGMDDGARVTAPKP
ncbi:MAG: efflux RND transporter periplasmic adaptor subunit [Gemmatimonadetes bacterium]|nr:efflux RND transporter periplasmic adaptor subunit [Gemmatimonadota bacterium]